MKRSNCPAWTPSAKASHLVCVVVTTMSGADVSRRCTNSASPKVISIQGPGPAASSGAARGQARSPGMSAEVGSATVRGLLLYVGEEGGEGVEGGGEYGCVGGADSVTWKRAAVVATCRHDSPSPQ